MKFCSLFVVLWAAVGAEELNDDFQFGCDNHYYELMELAAEQPAAYFADHDLQIDPLNVTFQLNTYKNQNESQLLMTGDIRALQSSHFNSSNPTRVIVHGFCNCHHSKFCYKTRLEFLNRQDYNIITINWQSGNHLLDYLEARQRIIPASKELAKFIDFLHNQGGLNLQDLYLIGHSLGAHLSGLAGKMITSGKINTIVGLDPAKPLFDKDKPDDRLADTDAQYVEVIHTNGGYLGLFDPIGHTDFYPNGGVHQPGCMWWWIPQWLQQLIQRWIPWMVASCSHGRAWEFYVESIVSKVGFWSTLCDSLSQVSPSGCRSPKAKLKMGGDPIIQQNRGILTVPTSSEPPYAKGK